MPDWLAGKAEGGRDPSRTSLFTHPVFLCKDVEMVAHSVSIPWSVLRTVISSLLGIGKLEQTDRMAVRLGQLTVFYWVNFSPGESQGESET